MILLAFLAQTLRIAIPYLFAAAGGVMSERAGLIGLTLEGYMLGGAFCAVAGSYCSRLAMGRRGRRASRAARVLALLYAVSAIRFRADQVVVGIAINLFAIGLTRFFLGLFFDSSSNSPRVAGFTVQGSGTGFGALLRESARLARASLVDPGDRVAAVPHAVRAARARRRRASGGGGVGRRAGGASALLAVLLSGMLAGAGRRVPRARPAPVHRRDDGGARLHRARGDDLRTVGSRARGPRLPALRRGGDAPDPAAGIAG